MNRKRLWLISLAILSAIAFMFSGYHQHQPSESAFQVPAAIAQPVAPSTNSSPSAPPAQIPSPPSPPLTSPPLTSPPLTSPPLTSPPLTSPPLTSPPGALPTIPVDPPGSPSFAPPASTAPPLPMGGMYQDPGGRFRVGILQDYKISPLAGSVLVESLDSNLAYIVVPQSQPLGNPIGLNAGYDNSDSLAKIAIAAFQRGEGFQPAPAQLEEGGGAVMNWSGTLTLAGATQPVSGVILVRPSSKYVLLMLVAATQAGANRVPGAVSALANSLEAL
nr:hypothetical protein [Leptolyngbya sp. Cla-17]